MKAGEELDQGALVEPTEEPGEERKTLSWDSTLRKRGGEGWAWNPTTP